LEQSAQGTLDVTLEVGLVLGIEGARRLLVQPAQQLTSLSAWGSNRRRTKSVTSSPRSRAARIAAQFEAACSRARV
jgi:hypothetical protein